MYDIISSIIDHSWTTNSSEQQYIYYVCCALIVIFSVVFIDFVKDIFSGFFRG